MPPNIPKLTKEKLGELHTQFGRVAHMVSPMEKDDGSPEWEFVIRKPTRAEFKVFRAMSSDDNRKADAQENFVRKLVVWPSVEEFNALMEEWPALCDGCGQALLTLSGASQKEAAK